MRQDPTSLVISFRYGVSTLDLTLRGSFVDPGPFHKDVYLNIHRSKPVKGSPVRRSVVPLC